LPRYILGIASWLSFITVISVNVALAGNVSTEEALSEMVLGSPDAPVTLIEHSSLSCPHCAAFHKDTFPQIKKNYIDTGKVKLSFQDFPLGNLALAGSMIARCSGKKNFFPMIEALFAVQETWTHTDTPLEALKGIARLSGMTEFDVEDCIVNEELMNGIRSRAQVISEKFGVNSTPTFFVNGKEVPGNLPYEDFKKVLDDALAASQ